MKSSEIVATVLNSTSSELAWTSEDVERVCPHLVAAVQADKDIQILVEALTCYRRQDLVSAVQAFSYWRELADRRAQENYAMTLSEQQVGVIESISALLEAFSRIPRSPAPKTYVM